MNSGTNHLNAKMDAYISLSLAMIIVGSSVVFGKMIIVKFPVFLACGLRFAIASVIIYPIILVKGKGLPGVIKKITKKDWFILASMTFCGQFMFTVLMLIGLKYTQAMEAGIITSTTPAFMIGVSFFVLREPLNARKISGVMLATLGILCVNGLLLPRNHLHGGDILGNLIICGAVAAEAFFLLLSKRLTITIPDLYITGILSSLGLLMFLPFAMYEGISFHFAGISGYDWLYILYFGAVYTVVAYILWFRGVAKVRGSTASVFTAVMPMSATMLSAVFLSEKFTLSDAIGVILVVASIVIMSLGKGDQTADTASAAAGR